MNICFFFLGTKQGFLFLNKIHLFQKHNKILFLGQNNTIICMMKLKFSFRKELIHNLIFISLPKAFEQPNKVLCWVFFSLFNHSLKHLWKWFFRWVSDQGFRFYNGKSLLYIHFQFSLLLLLLFFGCYVWLCNFNWLF